MCLHVRGPFGGRNHSTSLWSDGNVYSNSIIFTTYTAGLSNYEPNTTVGNRLPATVLGHKSSPWDTIQSQLNRCIFDYVSQRCFHLNCEPPQLLDIDVLYLCHRELQNNCHIPGGFNIKLVSYLNIKELICSQSDTSPLSLRTVKCV